MASSSSSSKILTLQTSENELFQLKETILLQSPTIKSMIEDDCAGSFIPLPNITAKVMIKVIEYCNKHEEQEEGNQTLEEWDKEFAKGLIGDLHMFCDLMLAAKYLDIKGLLDLTCKTVMKGKTPEEISELFHILYDFTKEEEEAVRRKNSWAFE